MSVRANISLLRSWVDLFLPRFYKHLAPNGAKGIGGLGANEPEYLKGFPDFDKWLHEQSGTLAELEANYVNEIPAATKGNKAEAARILGISRKNISESPDVIWSNG